MTQHIDQHYLNARNASRKEDREFIADTLMELVAKHGGSCERRSEPAVKGYSGQGIVLRFDCKGVGAMVDIDDLHGGDWALISWYNTKYPVHNFTPRFCGMIGDRAQARPHHKATSRPGNWYSLAMMLDAGLCLAARGEAFLTEEPVT